MLKVNNKDTSDVVLVSLLLTLNIFHTFFFSVSIVNFVQVNAGWVNDCILPDLFRINPEFPRTNSTPSFLNPVI